MIKEKYKPQKRRGGGASIEGRGGKVRLSYHRLQRRGKCFAQEIRRSTFGVEISSARFNCRCRNILFLPGRRGAEGGMGEG